MKTEFPYTAEKDEDGMFFVQFIDLEEAFTQGETLEEAAYNASEVLSAMLAYRMEKNQEIPNASRCPEDGFLAVPSPEVQAALLLRNARGSRPLSDVASSMNTSWPAAQRLENPHHWPSLKQLDKAARALGKRLVLSLE
ncbi:MAG: type II toxin-antitoxin system HicB family antitoxin [Methylobacter sp.]|nr:type II toxin-antitoxin system HicB family antitoxin [Methylococcales bacterium]MDD5113867.1 type II toxin-antitoxin system HicB family antitoxin [Methylobacter sp.]